MNDAAEIVEALKAVVATKSLSSDEVNNLLKEGIKAGLGRIYGPSVQAEISINDQSGGVDILVLRRVVEDVQDSSVEISLDEARWDDEGFEVGDVMEIPVEFSEFGRNAVMAVKQKIVQLVRENERDRIRYEFEDKIGQLVTGEVQQIESGKIIVLINGAPDADALIPWKEQNPRERFRQGDPIRCVLRKVDETPKGPRLILSRGSPLFVGALFKLEVPEIQQGIIEIKEIAREVGGRTKLAVYSHDESIDPVGSCVGLRGSRVQAVVQELGGERIDIVPWHAEPEVFARRSLAPARVSKVMSDPARRVITAIVNEDQLSLAIGRNGQNVRLASQLIGWQVDLYGSREWIELGAELGLFERETGEDEYESSDFALEELKLPEETLATLQGSGYTTFLQIIDFSKEDFVKIEGMSEAESEKLMELIEELTVLDEVAPSEPKESGQPDEESDKVEG
ncbi:MAG: transcription termination factor NusA, partial [bacterium]|jgi:N utilization substance protein A